MKERSAEDLKWINEHIRELQEKYPDMYWRFTMENVRG